MVHETRLRDSAGARRCKGRGCGVAVGGGPVDPLSLLKTRALWMVALRLVLLLEGASQWWLWRMVYNADLGC